jgi:para-nitrobenzyl esterase
MKYTNYLMLIIVFALAACEQEPAPPPSIQHSAPASLSPSPEPAEATPSGEESGAVDAASVAHELAGSSWQLVEIASMDDTVITPDDPANYTLSFSEDGTASIVADCNRGAGVWEPGASTQLTFGPIAATMAMCPPESISDRYLAQFEWVRSYVMRDGHLFLATMADGSIIEFSPAP